MIGFKYKNYSRPEMESYPNITSKWIKSDPYWTPTLFINYLVLPIYLYKKKKKGKK